MNKKILFLILLTSILFLPSVIFAVNELTTTIGGVSTALVLIGTMMVAIGWVIAGILYLTSAGSPEKTGIAKKALIAAVIGTILVIFAQYGYVNIKAILENIFQGK